MRATRAQRVPEQGQSTWLRDGTAPDDLRRDRTPAFNDIDSSDLEPIYATDVMTGNKRCDVEMLTVEAYWKTRSVFYSAVNRVLQP